jgi:hypothetical protein
VRSTEGQFPYWLGVDDRLTSDEFFRGSYTTGFWLKGEIVTPITPIQVAATRFPARRCMAADCAPDDGDKV